MHTFIYKKYNRVKLIIYCNIRYNVKFKVKTLMITIFILVDDVDQYFTNLQYKI